MRDRAPGEPEPARAVHGPPRRSGSPAGSVGDVLARGRWAPQRVRTTTRTVEGRGDGGVRREARNAGASPPRSAPVLPAPACAPPFSRQPDAHARIGAERSVRCTRVPTERPREPARGSAPPGRVDAVAAAPFTTEHRAARPRRGARRPW